MNKEAGWIAARTALVVTTAITAYFLLLFAVPLTYPFLIGWAIAMLAEPAVRWMERRFRFPRWAGVTLTLVLVAATLLTFLIILVSQIVIELTHLAELIPGWINQLNTYITETLFHHNNQLSNLIHNIQGYLEKNPEQRSEILKSIQNNIGVIANKGSQMITDIIAGIGTFLGNLPYYATVLVFSLLAAFFIGLDWPRLREKVNRLIPARIRTTGGLVIHDLKRALFGFVRAQLTLITITGIIVWLGLLIMGVEYSLTIALVAAAVDLLPYFGVGAVLVPWSLYLFLTGAAPLGTGIAILYLILILVRQFLEPKLVATNIGLDPLLTLFALFVGLKLLGVLGLVVGPVLAVILLALHRAGVFTDLWQYIVRGRVKKETTTNR
ncbi:sporulation integral membrane protein YtvI [Salinithrix halophila]|uniref:Sporulation integral membrane protein YtvI n=1 Tax=Salinithrix halophila TaxID=1485204 RepID=A0ABV8JD64_9BACL